MNDLVKAYQDAVCEICPILAGLDGGVVGSVLAELFAMYLASHMGDDRQKAREEVIQMWMESVRELVPIHEKIFLDRIKRRSN